VIFRSQDAIWTELGEQVFVLSISKGRYYELKGIGSYIWQALEEPRERAELTARILERYAVSPEQCEADLGRFMDMLLAAGLVSESTGAAADT
jgi:hypothetical protein